MLQSSLTLEILPYIIGLNIAKPVYDALQTSFSNLSHGSTLQLHMNLQNIPKGEKDITTYLREVKHVLDQLSAVGKPLDAKEMNAIIFAILAWILVTLSLLLHPELHQFHFMSFTASFFAMKLVS